MKRVLAFILSALLVFTISSPVWAHQQLDSATNHFRSYHGLHTLSTPLHLNKIARNREKQLYTLGFFHSFAWRKYVGGCAWTENIMYRIPAVAKNRGLVAFRAFRDSPVHRGQMLGRWSRTGSSIYIAPNGGMYVAQLFVRSC